MQLVNIRILLPKIIFKRAHSTDLKGYSFSNYHHADDLPFASQSKQWEHVWLAAGCLRVTPYFLWAAASTPDNAQHREQAACGVFEDTRDKVPYKSSFQKCTLAKKLRSQ